MVTQHFGETKPEYFQFPFGKPTPNDPTTPLGMPGTDWVAQTGLHGLGHSPGKLA